MGGKRVKSEPIWNVFLEDFNRKEIVIYNVFHSHTFLEQIKKEFRRYSKHKDIKKLEREIRSWAMYCFWSKCEYEIVITSFPERKEFKAAKVDVYRQLELNWKSFFNYIYENKAYFLRKKQKEQKSFYKCIDCGKECERTNSRQVRCKECQRKFKTYKQRAYRHKKSIEKKSI